MFDSKVVAGNFQADSLIEHHAKRTDIDAAAQGRLGAEEFYLLGREDGEIHVFGLIVDHRTDRGEVESVFERFGYLNEGCAPLDFDIFFDICAVNLYFVVHFGFS